MRKQRVQYSADEWKQLREEGAKILKDKPDIKPKVLLIWSMARLFPVERRYGPVAITKHCEKFYKDIQKLASSPQEVLPCGEYAAGTRLAKISFSPLEKAINDQLEALNVKINTQSTITATQPQPKYEELNYLNRKIDKLETLVTETKGLLLKVILTLDPAFFIKVDEQEIIEQLTPPKERLLKVAVVGLLGEQAHRLSEICRDEELCLLTPYTNVKESTVKGFNNYDYVIITRHVTHSVGVKAIKDLGRDKVIHLDTTSVDKIITTIRELIKENK